MVLFFAYSCQPVLAWARLLLPTLHNHSLVLDKICHLVGCEIYDPTINLEALLLILLASAAMIESLKFNMTNTQIFLFCLFHRLCLECELFLKNCTLHLTSLNWLYLKSFFMNDSGERLSGLFIVPEKHDPHTEIER